MGRRWIQEGGFRKMCVRPQLDARVVAEGWWNSRRARSLIWRATYYVMWV